ncbi:MAG: hypothetical protein JSR77_01725 [Planctomycetes bacterium]|nr:hypothetical protein [Planctomycetota bacterium]
MNKSVFLGSVGLAIAIAAAQPVQWRVEDGGNGHWYQVLPHDGAFALSTLSASFNMWYLQRGFYGPEGAYWQANSFATFDPATHLVHIGSIEENEFVRQLLVSKGKAAALIGLHQVLVDEVPPVESEPAGGWMWDSGDAQGFQNWEAGQPDNAGSGQHSALIDAISGRWSDYGGNACCGPDSMVIEYAQPIGPTARFVSSFALNKGACLRSRTGFEPAGPCFAIDRTSLIVYPGDVVAFFALIGDYSCQTLADWNRGTQNITSTEWFRDGVLLGRGVEGPTFAGYDGCQSYFEGSVQCETIAYSCNVADRSYSFTCARDSAGTYALVATNIFGKSTTLEFTVDVLCRADFNRDGGVDGADVGAFFQDWESGLDTADINEDSGVDGTDMQAFFEHWEDGC